jgi:hypothetical protein
MSSDGANDDRGDDGVDHKINQVLNLEKKEKNKIL